MAELNSTLLAPIVKKWYVCISYESYNFCVLIELAKIWIIIQ